MREHPEFIPPHFEPGDTLGMHTNDRIRYIRMGVEHGDVVADKYCQEMIEWEIMMEEPYPETEAAMKICLGAK